MKRAVRILSDLLALGLELTALYLLGRAVWRLPLPTGAKVLPVIAVLLLFGVIWGLWFSPSPRCVLPRGVYLTAKTLLLLFPALLHIAHCRRPMLLYIGGVLAITAVQALWGRSELAG